MASEKKWRLQVVKAADRSRHIIATLTGTSTLAQLQSIIQEKTGVAIHEQILAFGFPPVLINTSDPSQSTRTLADIGIKHGDSIELRDSEVEEVEVKQGKGWDYPPTIDPKKGGFTRREMPKDNSCLFHTIAYICNNKQSGNEAAHQMREMAANLVASDPVKYNTTFLGAPNQVYQDTVMHPSQWGGAIELSIFSIQFQTEIVAFDPKYLREDVYGEGQDYKKRAFLLYTGDHYDALVYSPTAGSSSASTDIVIFSIRDDMAYIRAREYVQSLHTELVKKGEAQEQKEWRTHQGMSREKQQQQAKQKEELKQAQIASRLQQIQFAETKQDSSPTPSTSSSTTTSTSTSTSQSDTWFCSVCTLENNPHATRCSACDTPSPFAPPTVTRASTSTSTSTSTPVRPLTGNIWTCETCTVANPKDVENCEVCGAPNPHHATNRAPVPHVQSQLIGGYDDWEDTPPLASRGGGMSYEEALRTATSVAAAPWKCPSCEYNNPALTGQCGLCQTPFANTPAAQAQILRTQNSTRVRPRPTSTSPSTSAPSRSTGSSGLSLFSSSSPNRWICESCGTDNHPNLVRCKACPNPNRALLMAQENGQCIIS